MDKAHSHSGGMVVVRVKGKLDPEWMGYFDGFSGVVEISASSGSIVIGRRRFGAGKITILPDSPHVFKFSGDVYRGKLRLEVKPDGQSFSVINVVPLETLP